MALEASAETEFQTFPYPETLSLWGKPEIHLRAPRVEDANELRAMMLANQERLEAFQPRRFDGITPFGISYSIGMALNMMRGGKLLDYYIVRDEKIIGEVGLRDINRNNKTPKLAYWVASEAEGQGYAYSASRRLVQFVFEETDVTKIMLRIDPRNSRSVSVARRLEAYQTGAVDTVSAEDGRSSVAYRIWEIDKQ